MYWSVVWCSGGCSWKCHKTLTFCSLLTRCTIPCACHAKRHLKLQKWSEHGVLCTYSLRNVLRATTACTFSTSQRPKVVRTPSVLGNVLRATTACTFSTSQSLNHLNFQKWSEHLVFLTFWLRNVLRATLSLSLPLSPSLSSVYLSSCLPVYLSIYLSIGLSVYLSICGAVSFSVM